MELSPKWRVAALSPFDPQFLLTERMVGNSEVETSAGVKLSTDGLPAVQEFLPSTHASRLTGTYPDTHNSDRSTPL